MLRKIGISVLLSLVLSILPVTSYADGYDPRCEKWDSTGECKMWAKPPAAVPVPGVPGKPAPVASNPAGPAQPGIPDSERVQRVCHRLDPQPLPTNPLWAGHTDGAIYHCDYHYPVPGKEVRIESWEGWMAEAPPTPPSIDQLREAAIAKLQFNAITIGIAPQDKPDSIGIIGLPVWMWAKNPDPTTIGPQTATAEKDGYSIRADARVEKILWNMGNGDTITCHKGTPYNETSTITTSPDCGYTYQHQGTYTITATSHWVIDWAGMGQYGTITMTLHRTTTITEAEIQVITNNGKK